MRPANPSNPTSLAYLLLKNSLKLYEKPWQQLSEEEKESARKEAAEDYRLQQLILQTNEGAGVYIAPTIPAEALGLIRQRFPDPESFKQELAAHGLNEETLLHAINEELRVDGALDIVAQKGGQPTEEEIVEFYKSNQDKLNIPERRKARHILITINDDFPDNTRTKSRQRMELVKKELATAPDKFEQLVQRYSECPSALRNGELGDLEPGQSFAALDKTLFALKENETSEIIESHLGFHIIRCDQITPAITPTYEKASPRIRALLTRKRQQQAQKAWLQELTRQNPD